MTVDFKAALRTSCTITTFVHVDAQRLSQEAFHGETYGRMLSGERCKWTAGAANHIAAVAFHMCDGAQLLVQQLTRRRDARTEAARRPPSEWQLVGQSLSRLAHQRVHLLGWKRVRKHLEELRLRGPSRPEPFLHAPSETSMEPVYASRSATGKYRTTPLRGLWQHPPYFHDGSAADLLAVVNHYDKVLSLGLTAAQKTDLVEFLKSL